VTDKNLDIKHLIVTNIYEWFIFDGKIFEELFFANKALVNQFCDFEAGRLSSTKTDFFYQQIAEPAITKVIEQIKFTHFDLRDLENLDLLDIYKILSPEHLLKLPFVNDSNTLNKPFYNELLYIIGLTEIKDKGKKLIGRMKEGDRCDGSLIENAISRLDSLDKIAQLKNPEEFGTKKLAEDTQKQKQIVQAIIQELKIYEELNHYQLKSQRVRQEIADLAQNAINFETYLQSYFALFQLLIEEVIKVEQEFYATVGEIKYLGLAE
jgi:hypothetical protein